MEYVVPKRLNFRGVFSCDRVLFFKYEKGMLFIICKGKITNVIVNLLSINRLPPVMARTFEESPLPSNCFLLDLFRNLLETRNCKEHTEAQKRSVHGVHEHSSTGVTQQEPFLEEFRKRSIQKAGSPWFS